MKTAINAIVLGLSLTLGGDCWGQAKDPNGLSRALALVKSPKASDRVKGFEQLAEIWNARPQLTSGGFSDTPIETKPKPEKKAQLPDESIDRIAKAIQGGMADNDADVRKAAAIAICSAPKIRPEVVSAFTIGLKSEDETVLWYVAQKADENPPPIESVIHSLIAQLGSDKLRDDYSVVMMLRAYGTKIAPYAEEIADAILSSKPDRRFKFCVLQDIQLPQSVAEKLAGAAKGLTKDELGSVAVLLLEHPPLLKQVAAERPETLPALEEMTGRIYSFLCQHQTEENEIRAWLASSDKLSPITMGFLRERRFVAKIAAAEVSVNSYEKHLLAACKRACGAPLGTQIIVDADHPVTFRPRSAWPNSDDRRVSKTFEGHGDGITGIMVTGEVRGADGKHPAAIAFFRTNDVMLLGSKENIAEDVLYDATTGRFVFYTKVFAAYSVGKGQPEPGPYQTGSAQVRVEAKGYQSLTFQFFDEMPDIVIMLSPRTEK